MRYREARAGGSHLMMHAPQLGSGPISPNTPALWGSSCGAQGATVVAQATWQTRSFPPPWSVDETDACFIEKPPRFGASNGPHGLRGCRNRLIERRLNAVRECSAPQSRDVPLRIADYCLAAMLVLGMLGAAAAENQVQGALQGQMGKSQKWRGVKQRQAT